MKCSPEEEERFFYWLGYRLFTTVLRGHELGHKRPLSTARDYLRVNGLKGNDRSASEFLIDVAKVGRSGGLSIGELFEKWSGFARWRPELAPRDEYSNEQKGFVRGYVVAVSNFARYETTPKRELASAGITRELAIEVGVLECDLEPLNGKFVGDVSEATQ